MQSRGVNMVLAMLALLTTLFACKSEEKKAPVIEEVEIEPVVEETAFGLNIHEYYVDTGLVGANQGLTHILPQFGVSSGDIHKIATQFDSVFDVRKIKPEHAYFMFCSLDSNHVPKCFIYEKNAVDYVVIDFRDSVNVYLGHKEVELREEEGEGIVTSSLWNAFIDKGMSPALVMEVSSLFAWSIDFFGIQKGDYFKVVYEGKYVEDEFIGIGDIKSVVFNHMGHDYYSFRYENDTSEFAYFTEKGESMKRALLSAPLEYRRISSRFSNRRFHPVLKIYRPHHGVDYAAPTGTPVVATGAGKVIFAARSGGAGKMVKIKHDVGDIVTKYLHLSKYGPGIKAGVHVAQGQKIGEVGSTGTSTGPHLDYRIYIRNKAVDPLSIDIPTADPLTGDTLERYMEWLGPVKERLDAIQIDTTRS